MAEHFSLIVVGTGFASSFFLLEYLKRAPPSARVLVLERGARITHKEISADRNRLLREGEATFVNRTPQKRWRFSVGLGGSSNCWGATTPRFLPEDFRLRSTYGVGRDWPITYDDLEEYYCQAEELMAVSGPPDSPAPRSRPYPQPPHRFSGADEVFKAAYGERYVHQAAARPTRMTAQRASCCGNSVCTHCPIDAKFTVLNELSHIFADPRVRLETGATVSRLLTRNHVALGVEYVKERRTLHAKADLVALGANAIHNPFLLLRSGLDHPQLGRNLHEQVAVAVNVNLKGLDNVPGSSIVVGQGYMLYQGEHRRERAAALMDSWSLPLLRDERGKWRQFLHLTFVYEDLPDPANRVSVSRADNAPGASPGEARPTVEFVARSAYCNAGIDALQHDLPRLLAPLPVEDFKILRDFSKSESHILGTTRMGHDRQDSVIDADLVHHRVRNLLVLGSGAFPSGSPSHPTLTLSALSLRAATRLMQRGAPV